MNKPNFDKCTREATKLLYKQNISDRILDITRLSYDKPIIFESIQTYCQYTQIPLQCFLSNENDILKDGCTLYDKDSGYYIILYNDEIRYFEHRNWTLAHEIGHIYLGHTKDDELEEIEAHFFASQLFMPEFSLYMMAQEHGTIFSDDIVEVFGVSDEAARKRIATMKKKTMFNASQMDKEIWQIQKKRIDFYYQCKKNRQDYRSGWDFLQYMDQQFESTLKAGCF